VGLKGGVNQQLKRGKGNQELIWGVGGGTEKAGGRTYLCRMTQGDTIYVSWEAGECVGRGRLNLNLRVDAILDGGLSVGKGRET